MARFKNERKSDGDGGGEKRAAGAVRRKQLNFFGTLAEA